MVSAPPTFTVGAREGTDGKFDYFYAGGLLASIVYDYSVEMGLPARIDASIQPMTATYPHKYLNSPRDWPEVCEYKAYHRRTMR
jgi:hypothetical protein